MGCLKLYEEEYKRINNKMLFGKNKNEEQIDYDKIADKVVERLNVTKTPVKEDDTNGKKTTIWQKYGGVVGPIVTVVIAIITSWGVVKQDIVALQKDIENLSDDVEYMSKQVSEMYGDLYNNNGIIDQLEDVDIIVLNANQKAANSLAEVSVESNEISLRTTSLTDSTSIGSDSSGKVYSKEELIGKKILLTYKENGNDVYFLGQYNENYNWDGFCVTNTYNTQGVLCAICESNFTNGERVDYKSFYLLNENEWIYSSRVYSDKERSGISIQYAFKCDVIKNFTNISVREPDILLVDSFIEISDVGMIQYYNGNTSDGRYNDTTGEAYHVKYDKDGTILTLYVGNFVNGTYNDTTGNAWDIAYSEECDMYVYNTGKFSNGGAVKKSTRGISMEEINEIIAPYNFECELKWKDCFEEVESEMLSDN